MCEQVENQKILCDIANCAFDVVSQLLNRDQLLARQLRSDSTTSRQIYREEGITVEMASTLQERFPKHVEITLFTMPEETRNGADWYWRFQKGDRAIHARVQAKRVQRTEFGQDDAGGHIDVDVSQLGDLVSEVESARNQLPELQAWLLTYARFAATPPCGQLTLSHCNSHGHEDRCAGGGSNPSIWIAQALEIRELNTTQFPVREIVEKSVRLDCILPCIDTSGSQGPSQKGFTLRDGLRPYEECVEIIERNVLLRTMFAGAMRIIL